MTISAFNTKRVTGLFLMILVSVGLITNSMKESEKQKLGRLVESRCAMEGLSKMGCKIKLLLAELKVKAELLNRLGSSNDNTQLGMELLALKKEQEALYSLEEESNDLLTASDVQVLFHTSAHTPSTGDEYALMGTISMVTREDLLEYLEAKKKKIIQLIKSEA